MSTSLKAITDGFTTKINDVDPVDASHINNLQQAVKQLAGSTLTQAGYMNYEFLAATRQLTNDDVIYQVYYMNSVDQTVKVPDGVNENHPFLIWNYDALKSITIKDYTGTTTLHTLLPKDYVLMIPLGGEWISFKAGFDPYFNIQVVLGDGLNVLTTGAKGDLEVPYKCQVVGWTILESTGASGTCWVDVWRDIFVNFPPTVDDSICGTEKPYFTGVLFNQNLNLTTWASPLNKGDILRFNVEYAAAIRQVTVSLRCKRL